MDSSPAIMCCGVVLIALPKVWYFIPSFHPKSAQRFLEMWSEDLGSQKLLHRVCEWPPFPDTQVCEARFPSPHFNQYHNSLNIEDDVKIQLPSIELNIKENCKNVKQHTLLIFYFGNIILAF